jgi:hypothetical protein
MEESSRARGPCLGLFLTARSLLGSSRRALFPHSCERRGRPRTRACPFSRMRRSRGELLRAIRARPSGPARHSHERTSEQAGVDRVTSTAVSIVTSAAVSRDVATTASIFGLAADPQDSSMPAKTAPSVEGAGDPPKSRRVRPARRPSQSSNAPASSSIANTSPMTCLPAVPAPSRTRRSITNRPTRASTPSHPASVATSATSHPKPVRPARHPAPHEGTS